MYNDEKLQTLIEEEGYTEIMDYLEDYGHESIVTGICTNTGCDYTTSVEPDCAKGYCEECDTNTVSSFLVLMGII